MSFIFIPVPTYLPIYVHTHVRYRISNLKCIRYIYIFSKLRTHARDYQHLRTYFTSALVERNVPFFRGYRTSYRSIAYRPYDTTYYAFTITSYVCTERYTLCIGYVRSGTEGTSPRILCPAKRCTRQDSSLSLFLS